MSRNIVLLHLILSFILNTIHIQAQLIPAGVNITGKVSSQIIKTKKISSGFTLFQKEGIQLTIPAGWRNISLDSTFHEGPNRNKMIALTNDKGDFAWLWCDLRQDVDVPLKPMEEDLTRTAPLNEHVKITLIKGDGPDMAMYTFKAYEIRKGQKKPYTIFTGYRAEPTFKPGSGIPRFFVKCLSEDRSGEIEKDVISIAEHLQIYHEKEKNEEDYLAKMGIKIDIDKIVKNVVKDVVYRDVSLNWSIKYPKSIVVISPWQIRSSPKPEGVKSVQLLPGAEYPDSSW